MEDDKKKKKNKKKKNKQAKTTDDSAVPVRETGSLNQNHVVDQNHHSQASVTADVQDGAVLKTDIDLDRHHNNGSEGAVVAFVAEADKQHWLQREARLDETIKQLENEKDSYIQKEAGLEMKIAQLQCEKDLWLQKEVSLEEKISQLLDEKATLSLKVASLEENVKYMERDKESWVLRENITGEKVASLNDDNTRLQLRVIELEESRNNLLRENQQLMENVSGLRSQIQSLERISSSNHSSIELRKHASGNEDSNSQMDATHEPVEKLVKENAELVEKVNDLYVDLDKRNATTGLSSADGFGPLVGAAGASNFGDPMSEFQERTSPSGERMEPLNVASIKDERIGDKNIDIEYTAVLLNSPETGQSGEILQIPESGEIVQIPLDENEVQDQKLQATEDDEKAVVSLSDAPLIGAPFRLISFVAKYVSGADLVNRGS